ncbi:MAG: Putative regulatory protein, contains AAA+ NTPase domain and putative R3H ssDNA-binding domain [Ktedonobacterales bacterium]|jgi:stage III sporulation protein SpoIIIAA|nr:MAG: Putative regulatory protein, contains AAA+ NTPase domain and putative R3H ssDNA-binding domain [Ktedonobacterales bacterium]
MRHAITDDLGALLAVLPPRVCEAIARLEDRADLLEIVLDLGRLPEGRFPTREVPLSDTPITDEDIAYVVERIGAFGDDNRAGIERTLHRISAIRNRRGQVVGLTCRVGRAVRGTVALIRDVLEQGKSILILGRPGVGKTTLLREAARVLADELGKRVVVVDTSNEIAGDGDVPHPGIGRARRMQVARTTQQHQVMIEAVENHMPEVIVIDEIGTELEAQAARTIAERGVQLVGTAHGRTLDNLLVNPTLADLVGGVQAVTLGDEEARRRGTQKTVLERKSPPTFDVLVEQESWQRVILHADVASAVDGLLRGQAPLAEARERDEHDQVTSRSVAVKPEGQLATRSGFAPDGEAGFDTGTFGRRSASRGMGRVSKLHDPRRAGYDELTLLRAESEAVDFEAEEPTGTTGALTRPAGGKRRPVRIYPFGISRERLEQSARQLKVPVEISRDQTNADAVMTLKTFYRRQSGQLRDAATERKPIYVLRTNTVAQMQECLARIFELRQSEASLADGGPRNPTTLAMQETEDAIHHMLNDNRDRVELTPQNAYVRRLQHQIAGRYNLESRSLGREPNRRVQIWAR